MSSSLGAASLPANSTSEAIIVGGCLLEVGQDQQEPQLLAPPQQHQQLQLSASSPNMSSEGTLPTLLKVASQSDRAPQVPSNPLSFDAPTRTVDADANVNDAEGDEEEELDGDEAFLVDNRIPEIVEALTAAFVRDRPSNVREYAANWLRQLQGRIDNVCKNSNAFNRNTASPTSTTSRSGSPSAAAASAASFPVAGAHDSPAAKGRHHMRLLDAISTAASATNANSNSTNSNDNDNSGSANSKVMLVEGRISFALESIDMGDITVVGGAASPPAPTVPSASHAQPSPSSISSRSATAAASSSKPSTAPTTSAVHGAASPTSASALGEFDFCSSNTMPHKLVPWLIGSGPAVVQQQQQQKTPRGVGKKSSEPTNATTAAVGCDSDAVASPQKNVSATDEVSDAGVPTPTGGGVLLAPIVRDQLPTAEVRGMRPVEEAAAESELSGSAPPATLNSENRCVHSNAAAASARSPVVTILNSLEFDDAESAGKGTAVLVGPLPDRRQSSNHPNTSYSTQSLLANAPPSEQLAHVPASALGSPSTTESSPMLRSQVPVDPHPPVMDSARSTPGAVPTSGRVRDATDSLEQAHTTIVATVGDLPAPAQSDDDGAMIAFVSANSDGGSSAHAGAANDESVAPPPAVVGGCAMAAVPEAGPLSIASGTQFDIPPLASGSVMAIAGVIPAADDEQSSSNGDAASEADTVPPPPLTAPSRPSLPFAEAEADVAGPLGTIEVHSNGGGTNSSATATLPVSPASAEGSIMPSRMSTSHGALGATGSIGRGLSLVGIIDERTMVPASSGVNSSSPIMTTTATTSTAAGTALTSPLTTPSTTATNSSKIVSIGLRRKDTSSPREMRTSSFLQRQAAVGKAYAVIGGTSPTLSDADTDTDPAHGSHHNLPFSHAHAHAHGTATFNSTNIARMQTITPSLAHQMGSPGAASLKLKATSTVSDDDSKSRATSHTTGSTVSAGATMVGGGVSMTTIPPSGAVITGVGSGTIIDANTDIALLLGQLSSPRDRAGIVEALREMVKSKQRAAGGAHHMDGDAFGDNPLMGSLVSGCDNPLGEITRGAAVGAAASASSAAPAGGGGSAIVNIVRQRTLSPNVANNLQQQQGGSMSDSSNTHDRSPSRLISFRQTTMLPSQVLSDGGGTTSGGGEQSDPYTTGGGGSSGAELGRVGSASIGSYSESFSRRSARRRRPYKANDIRNLYVSGGGGGRVRAPRGAHPSDNSLLSSPQLGAIDGPTTAAKSSPATIAGVQLLTVGTLASAGNESEFSDGGPSFSDGTNGIRGRHIVGLVSCGAATTDDEGTLSTKNSRGEDGGGNPTPLGGASDAPASAKPPKGPPLTLTMFPAIVGGPQQQSTTSNANLLTGPNSQVNTTGVNSGHPSTDTSVTTPMAHHSNTNPTTAASMSGTNPIGQSQMEGRNGRSVCNSLSVVATTPKANRGVVPLLNIQRSSPHDSSAGIPVSARGNVLNGARVSARGGPSAAVGNSTTTDANLLSATSMTVLQPQGSPKFHRRNGGGGNTNGPRRRVGVHEIRNVEKAANFVLKEYPKTEDEWTVLMACVNRCTLFTAFDEEEKRKVVSAMFPKEFPAGAEVLSQGFPGQDTFFLIVGGKAEVLKDCKVVVSLGVGEYFGELELMYHVDACAATIKCITPVITYALEKETYSNIVLNATLARRRIFLDQIHLVDFFKVLSEYDQMRLAEALSIKKFERDEFLIRCGEQVDFMYMIMSGKVSVIGRSKADPSTREHVVDLGAGQVVGELEFLFQHSAIADVVAIEGLVTVAKLSRQHFTMIMGDMFTELKSHVAQGNYAHYLQHVNDDIRKEVDRADRAQKKRNRTRRMSNGGRSVSRASLAVSYDYGYDGSDDEINDLNGVSNMDGLGSGRGAGDGNGNDEDLEIEQHGEIVLAIKPFLNMRMVNSSPMLMNGQVSLGQSPGNNTSNMLSASVTNPNIFLSVDGGAGQSHSNNNNNNHQLMSANGMGMAMMMGSPRMAPTVFARFPAAVTGGDNLVMIVIQEDGTIIHWNSVIARLTQFKAEDVIGQSIFSFLTNEEQQKTLHTHIRGVCKFAGDYEGYLAQEEDDDAAPLVDTTKYSSPSGGGGGALANAISNSNFQTSSPTGATPHQGKKRYVVEFAQYSGLYRVHLSIDIAPPLVAQPRNRPEMVLIVGHEIKRKTATASTDYNKWFLNSLDPLLRAAYAGAGKIANQASTQLSDIQKQLINLQHQALVAVSNGGMTTSPGGGGGVVAKTSPSNSLGVPSKSTSPGQVLLTTSNKDGTTSSGSKTGESPTLSGRTSPSAQQQQQQQQTVALIQQQTDLLKAMQTISLQQANAVRSMGKTLRNCQKIIDQFRSVSELRGYEENWHPVNVGVMANSFLTQLTADLQANNNSLNIIIADSVPDGDIFIDAVALPESILYLVRNCNRNVENSTIDLIFEAVTSDGAFSAHAAASTNVALGLPMSSPLLSNPSATGFGIGSLSNLSAPVGGTSSAYNRSVVGGGGGVVLASGDSGAFINVQALSSTGTGAGTSVTSSRSMESQRAVGIGIVSTNHRTSNSTSATTPTNALGSASHNAFPSLTNGSSNFAHPALNPARGALPVIGGGSVVISSPHAHAVGAAGVGLRTLRTGAGGHPHSVPISTTGPGFNRSLSGSANMQQEGFVSLASPLQGPSSSTALSGGGNMLRSGTVAGTSNSNMQMGASAGVSDGESASSQESLGGMGGLNGTTSALANMASVLANASADQPLLSFDGLGTTINGRSPTQSHASGPSRSSGGTSGGVGRVSSVHHVTSASPNGRGGAPHNPAGTHGSIIMNPRHSMSHTGPAVPLHETGIYQSMNTGGGGIGRRFVAEEIGRGPRSPQSQTANATNNSTNNNRSVTMSPSPQLMGSGGNSPQMTATDSAIQELQMVSHQLSQNDNNINGGGGGMHSSISAVPGGRFARVVNEASKAAFVAGRVHDRRESVYSHSGSRSGSFCSTNTNTPKERRATVTTRQVGGPAGGPKHSVVVPSKIGTVPSPTGSNVGQFPSVGASPGNNNSTSANQPPTTGDMPVSFVTVGNFHHTISEAPKPTSPAPALTPFDVNAANGGGNVARPSVMFSPFHHNSGSPPSGVFGDGSPAVNNNSSQGSGSPAAATNTITSGTGKAPRSISVSLSAVYNPPPSSTSLSQSAQQPIPMGSSSVRPNATADRTVLTAGGGSSNAGSSGRNGGADVANRVLQITIRDSGSGINPAIIKKVNNFANQFRKKNAAGGASSNKLNGSNAAFGNATESLLMGGTDGSLNPTDRDTIAASLRIDKLGGVFGAQSILMAASGKGQPASSAHLDSFKGMGLMKVTRLVMGMAGLFTIRNVQQSYMKYCQALGIAPHQQQGQQGHVVVGGGVAQQKSGSFMPAGGGGLAAAAAVGGGGQHGSMSMRSGAGAYGPSQIPASQPYMHQVGLLRSESQPGTQSHSRSESKAPSEGAYLGEDAMLDILIGNVGGADATLSKAGPQHRSIGGQHSSTNGDTETMSATPTSLASQSVTVGGLNGRPSSQQSIVPPSSQFYHTVNSGSAPHGTEFIITIPLAIAQNDDDDDDGTKSDGTAADGGARQNFTTILIENSSMDRNMICRLLWGRKHAVLPANGWRDLSRLADAGTAEILIVDPESFADAECASTPPPNLLGGAGGDDATFQDVTLGPIERLAKFADKMAILIMSSDFNGNVVGNKMENGIICLPKPCPPALLHNSILQAETLMKGRREQQRRIAKSREVLSKMNHAAITKIKRIGRGAFGEVWEVEDTITKGRMAMKELKTKSEEAAAEVLREIQAMTSLKHENIIHYIYCERVDDINLKIFMELAVGGTIMDKIKALQEERKDPMSMAVIVPYVRDILKGLDYIHKNRWVHCDIKPHNVLLDVNGRCKLGDFGTATHLALDNEEGVTATKGTPAYMAPEVTEAEPGKGFDMKADIWSLGATVMEMATGIPPFSHLQEAKGQRVMYYVSSLKEAGQMPNLSPLFNCDPLIFEFVSACMNPEPSLRPSAEELMSYGMVAELGPNAVAGAGKVLRRAQLMHILNQFVAFKEPDTPPPAPTRGAHNHTNGNSKGNTANVRKSDSGESGGGEAGNSRARRFSTESPAGGVNEWSSSEDEDDDGGGHGGDGGNASGKSKGDSAIADDKLEQLVSRTGAEGFFDSDEDEDEEGDGDEGDEEGSSSPPPTAAKKGSDESLPGGSPAHIDFKLKVDSASPTHTPSTAGTASSAIAITVGGRSPHAATVGVRSVGGGSSSPQPETIDARGLHGGTTSGSSSNNLATDDGRPLPAQMSLGLSTSSNKRRGVGSSSTGSSVLGEGSGGASPLIVDNSNNAIEPSKSFDGAIDFLPLKHVSSDGHGFGDSMLSELINPGGARGGGTTTNPKPTMGSSPGQHASASSVTNSPGGLAPSSSKKGFHYHSPTGGGGGSARPSSTSVRGGKASARRKDGNASTANNDTLDYTEVFHRTVSNMVSGDFSAQKRSAVQPSPFVGPLMGSSALGLRKLSVGETDDEDEL